MPRGGEDGGRQVHNGVLSGAGYHGIDEIHVMKQGMSAVLVERPLQHAGGACGERDRSSGSGASRCLQLGPSHVAEHDAMPRVQLLAGHVLESRLRCVFPGEGGEG